MLWQMKTPFGQRLFDARKHAKLTQTQLAKAVGMSQGTYAEQEKFGSFSSFTPAIATVCGVDVTWLAYGTGEMLVDQATPYPPQDRAPVERVSERRTSYHSIPSIEDSCNALARYLEGLPSADKESAAGLLASMARMPAIAPHIIDALVQIVAHAKQEHPEQSTGTGPA